MRTDHLLIRLVILFANDKPAAPVLTIPRVYDSGKTLGTSCKDIHSYPGEEEAAGGLPEVTSTGTLHCHKEELP
jgi:hypothetical protein